MCAQSGPAILFQERHIANLFGFALEDPLQERIEIGTVSLGNEQSEAAVHQSGALHADQARAGEVGLRNRSIAVEGEVAHGGEVVEVGVAFQRGFHLRPRKAQLLVLHLQFDLVHLQFVDELLGVGVRVRNVRFGIWSFGIRTVLSLFEPLLGVAPDG